MASPAPCHHDHSNSRHSPDTFPQRLSHVPCYNNTISLQKLTFYDIFKFTVTNLLKEGYMRKPALIIAAVIFLLIMLFQPNVSGALFALIFLGMIPGTTVNVPSWMMLLGSLIGMVVAIRWLSQQPMFIGNYAQQEKTARQLARKKVLAMSAAPTPIRRKPTTARRRPAKA